MEFRFENSQIAVFFPKIPAIRRKVFELEELLSDRFLKPFTMLQVPDDAPEEIPRIQAKTKNGHTILTISQSSISLVTNFDNGFETDWGRTHEYLQKNLELVYIIAENVGANSLLYSGFSVNLFFPFLSGTEVMTHVKKVFFPEKNLSNLHEFNLRFVQKKDDVYFINCTFASTVKYVSHGIPIRAVPAYLKANEFGIILNIDVNDRYGANFEREYLSNKKNGTKLIEYLNQIISNKIDSLMQKGDFNI